MSVSTKKQKQELPLSSDSRLESDFSLIIGPPKRGKSHLIRWLIIEGMMQGKWDHIVVCTPTKHSGDYDFISPQSCIHGDPGKGGKKFVQVAETLMKQQQYISVKLGRAPKKGEGRVLFVLDDGLGSVHWNEEIWTRLSTTYRHYGIDFMVSTQSITKIPRSFYITASKGYLFRLDMMTDIDYLWERWVGTFETGLKNHNELNDYMKSNMPIEAYKYLKIDRNKSSDNVELTKAPPRSQFGHFKVQL